MKLFENLPLPPVYYHGREASYWREDDHGGWIKINENAVRLFVADHGYASWGFCARSFSYLSRRRNAVLLFRTYAKTLQTHNTREAAKLLSRYYIKVRPGDGRRGG